MTSQTVDRFEVRSFGNDCMGNITGYRVQRGYGWHAEIASQFIGDIYEPGSFERARQNADALCVELNALTAA